MDKLLLTVDEAAQQLGIGRTKLYELMGSGELATIHIGSAVRIPWSSIEEWVQRQLKAASDHHAV